MGLNPAIEEIVLSSGAVLPIGINFFALEKMMKYPGGIKKLNGIFQDLGKLTAPQENTEDSTPRADFTLEELPDNMDEIMNAFSYILWCLVRGAGVQCTQEECAMALGLEDFDQIEVIFTRMEKAMGKFTSKNVKSRARKK